MTYGIHVIIITHYLLWNKNYYLFTYMYMKIEFREHKFGGEFVTVWDEDHSESQLNGLFLFAFNPLATLLNPI